jgi:pyridoxamine 5'-phosphate oxidase
VQLRTALLDFHKVKGREMALKEYADFANENRTCYIATADGDQPRVRAVGMWFADETGFYFQIGGSKAVSKQMQKNDKIEVYYNTKDFSKVMRVAGRVKPVDDLALKAKCLEERPFLKERGVTDPSDPRLMIFHLYTGEAYFWTFADSEKEADIPREKF